MQVQLPSFPDLDNETFVAKQRSECKEKLRSLLKQHDGCTKHPDVMKVIEQLSDINPSRSDDNKHISESLHFEGDYQNLSSPTFPGRLNPDDVGANPQYQLGRMSFNIFKPHDLVCSILTIGNPVKKKQDGDRFTYTFVIDLIIHTPKGQDLPATMVNEGHCYANPSMENRVSVCFIGGTLIPKKGASKEESKLWSETFSDSIQDTSSYVSRFIKYVFFLLLGITQDHVLHFAMNRCPTGHFDVLYLDEELRITRGNRKTVVVVERKNSSVSQNAFMQVVG
mmetsp:Transcript_20632/g.31009  ORF Transcript_20632/g.31009 Transcript_20632/m.31009 type:complete len:281 (-) Transcript_20632:1057-1899(-)